MIGWCVKCQKKREMKSPKKSKTSKGVLMTKGLCSHCNCKMCRIGE